jgi:hypothetical protein
VGGDNNGRKRAGEDPGSPLLPLKYFLSLFFHLFSFPFLAFLEITFFSFFLLISIKLNDKFKSKTVLTHLNHVYHKQDENLMSLLIQH